MTPSAAAAVDFLTHVGHLKLHKRTGWVRCGVPSPESVADHIYRMSIAALLSADTDGLDPSACAVIALAHDLPEALTGDIVPGDVPPSEKRAAEAAALVTLCAGLEAGGYARAGAQIRGAWAAYEAQSTPEARFVKSLDKFELLLQAHEYEERADAWLDLSQFFSSTPLAALPTASVRAWAEEVVRRRAWQPTGAAARGGGGGGGASSSPPPSPPLPSPLPSLPPSTYRWWVSLTALVAGPPPPAAFWAGAAVGATAAAAAAVATAFVLAHPSR